MQREAKSKAQVLGHGFIAGLGAPPCMAWPGLAPPHPLLCAVVCAVLCTLLASSALGLPRPRAARWLCFANSFTAMLDERPEY